MTINIKSYSEMNDQETKFVKVQSVHFWDLYFVLTDQTQYLKFR